MGKELSNEREAYLKNKEAEIRERVADVDFSKVVCPITFINDRITNSDSVNGLYIHPYVSHNAMKLVSNEFVKEIAPNLKNEYEMSATDSLRSAILAYFHMNLYSITYDTLVKFIQEAFEFEIDNKLLPDGINRPAAIYIVEKYINLINMDLQKELEELPSYYTFLMVTNYINEDYRKLNFASMHEILAAQMSVVFGQVVDCIFNKAINKIVDNALKEDSFETIFDIIYYSCYNEKPDKASKNNVQVMIQFVSGYLRQIMEGHLEMYRNGLDLMTMTITGMIVGKETV